MRRLLILAVVKAVWFWSCAAVPIILYHYDLLN